MDFREEYKKQAEVMTPSAEAMERMTKNIMEQINAPAKKAIPFRKISYIGGAVAACAVIAVGAVKLLPSMESELATADAALTDSTAAVYQENAAADEEGFTPVNGIQSQADSDNTKLEYALGDSAATSPDTDAVYDEAMDAAEDTAAVISPIISENEDIALPSDKTFAEGAPTEAVENTAPEEVMEEAEAAVECATEESYMMHETAEIDIDAGIITEAIPECPTELIYVTDDMQSFTIGNTEYFVLPWHNGTIIEKGVAYYTGSDGRIYEVIDGGDIVVLIHGDYRGFYCTSDMYDYMIKLQN